MGNLTEDMRRLHQEIDSLHANRKVFINGLVSEVENLRDGVLTMQSGFHKARIDRMQETKAGLSGFMTNLKHTVAGLRADISADILKSRRIWSESPRPESATRPNIKIHITPHIKEEPKPEPKIKRAKPAVGGSKGKAKIEVKPKALPKNGKTKKPSTPIGINKDKKGKQNKNNRPIPS